MRFLVSWKRRQQSRGIIYESRTTQENFARNEGYPREQKQFIDQALTERLLHHPFYQEARVIASYLSFPHEFQTQELIEQALKDGKKVLIPKTYPKGRMDFVVYDPQQLVKTSFGLLEPTGRLGSGGCLSDWFDSCSRAGFYERGLSDWLWWRLLWPLSETFLLVILWVRFILVKLGLLYLRTMIFLCRRY